MLNGKDNYRLFSWRGRRRSDLIVAVAEYLLPANQRRHRIPSQYSPCKLKDLGRFEIRGNSLTRPIVSVKGNAGKNNTLKCRKRLTSSVEMKKTARRRCMFVEQCWNDGEKGKRRPQNKHDWHCVYNVTL